MDPAWSVEPGDIFSCCGSGADVSCGRIHRGRSGLFLVDIPGKSTGKVVIPVRSQNLKGKVSKPFTKAMTSI